MDPENQVQAEEQQTQVSETPDIFSMSDEEISNLDLTFLDQGSDEGSQEGALDESEGEEESVPDGEVEADVDEDPAGEAEESEEDEEADTDAGTEEAESDTEEDATEEETSEDSDSVDYKAAYEQIFAPFKANGKEIQAKDVQDVVALMQMGANYNKKMAALKPNLKLLKLLEKNSLLEESKLSYLIDLEQKKPEAIQKLIKDSGIDPLDIDTEKESEYTPEVRTVDDRELELDAVLDEIKDTPTYRETINIVSSKWDGPSKTTVAQNPQLLTILNDHVASGVYKIISDEIESERTFGRLKGVSDLEAYRQVGDAIQARGGFNHLFQQKQDDVETSAPKQSASKPKAEDPKLKSKKRAASSTRKAPSTTSAPDYNPLSMSDADFEKLINERLM